MDVAGRGNPSLRHVDGEIVDYTVKPSAAIAGVVLRQLARPDGMVVTLVLRHRTVAIPRGTTALMPGDHVFVALRSSVKPLMDRMFAPDTDAVPLPDNRDLMFPATTTLEQLQRFFALAKPLPGAAGAESLGQLLRRHCNDALVPFGPLRFTPADQNGIVRVTTTAGVVQTER